MQISVAAILVASVFLASTAKADKLPLPTAAYSADVTFIANGHESTGHINVDGPKERREIRSASGTHIEIIRRDQGKVYDLRPQKHMAVALRMAAAEAAGETGAPGTDVDSFYGADVQPDGTETVNGLQTTKYGVKIEAGPELTVNATVWATDDGIIVKVVGKTSVDGDAPPARMELKNIQAAPQDAALFELPPGMTVLSPNNDLPPEPSPN
jgi:hypothetical protein